MTDEKPVEKTWEPAVFPLAGVELNPPLFVAALSNRGGLKKGSQYYLGAVRGDGQVAVIGGGWHKMDEFVQLLHARERKEGDPPARSELGAAERVRK